MIEAVSAPFFGGEVSSDAEFFRGTSVTSIGPTYERFCPNQVWKSGRFLLVMGITSTSTGKRIDSHRAVSWTPQPWISIVFSYWDLLEQNYTGGVHCLVTAGPTYEPLDEVRRLTNFSTGQLGTELAAFLTANGHRVTLLIGEQSTYRG